jgi:hypothetical protein
LIPGKAPSEVEQREFIRQIDYYSQQKETVLLFFDACHLLHNVVNARMWQPRGKKGTIVMKSNTGRKRINILGALDIEDLSTHITLTEETCNAERVVEFLQKVRAYSDAKIVVVLDNARYNYAKATQAFAEENNILLLFLPLYSPNFSQFVDAADTFFNNLGAYYQELESLLTQKFQIIHAE